MMTTIGKRLSDTQQPNAEHWKEAARIVAEMMLHIGRGQAAAAAGAGAQPADLERLVIAAPLPITYDGFAAIYEMFLGATAYSLANGRLVPGGWGDGDRTRGRVTRCCIHMGWRAQELAAAATGDITDQILKSALKFAREKYCDADPEHRGGNGGGATCPPDADGF